jgi:hypothetical protein
MKGGTSKEWDAILTGLKDLIKERNEKFGLENFEKMKKDSLREDYRPSEGIWYWVWLKPKWKLMEFKATEYGDLTHEDAWRRYVSDNLVVHYNIREGVDEIKDAYTGMPRGRVAHVGKKWVFYHGDDTPINFAKAKIQIVSRFELTKQALAGQVEFKFDEHETMQEDDRAIVKKYIGDVPY